MEISQKNKYRGAEIAALLELKETYQKMGYRAIEEYQLDGLRYDLYVEKDDVKILFEFKSRTMNKDTRMMVEKKREIAKAHDMHFRVVLAPVPSDSQIEVDGIESTIEEEFRNNIPDDLDCLSPHTYIVEVEEVKIKEIKIKSQDEILVKGKSEVIVDLTTGDNDEGDSVYTTSFPFTFSGQWSFENDGTLKLVELLELHFDTSSIDK